MRGNHAQRPTMAPAVRDIPVSTGECSTTSPAGAQSPGHPRIYGGMPWLIVTLVSILSWPGCCAVVALLRRDYSSEGDIVEGAMLGEHG